VVVGSGYSGHYLVEFWFKGLGTAAEEGVVCWVRGAGDGGGGVSGERWQRGIPGIGEREFSKKLEGMLATHAAGRGKWVLPGRMI